jgi:hypothetical protein
MAKARDNVMHMAITRSGLLIATLMFACCSAGAAPPTATVSSLVREIKAEAEGSPERDRKAADLVFFVESAVKNGHQDEITDQQIDEIGSLLKFRDVRDWMAVALERLGHRALRTEPLLQDALTDEFVQERKTLAETGILVAPPVDSIGVICRALRNVGSHRLERCRAALSNGR